MSNFNNSKPGQTANSAQGPSTPSAASKGTQQQGQQNKANLQGGTKPNMGGTQNSNKDDHRK